jgi:hypothetical protein
MSRILEVDRAIQLGRTEQELYHKINCLNDQSATELFLEHAECLMRVLLEQCGLLWDGTPQEFSAEETSVILKRIDELDELIDRIEQLRRHLDITRG